MNIHPSVCKANRNLNGIASALRESESPTKLVLYSHDIYFMETWWVLGTRDSDCPHHICKRFTYLLFKPDGLRRDTVGKALAAMKSSQFAVKHFEFVDLSRHATRALWQYDLNLATAERMSAVDILFSTRQSLLVFFEDQSEASGHAAKRLASMKGPSRPSEEKPLLPHHLRSVIGSWGGMLNFIHSPDDVWDFIRELAILAGKDRIADVVSKLLSPQVTDADEVLMAVDGLRLEPEMTPDDALGQVASELNRNGKDLQAFMLPSRAGKIDWRAALGQLGTLDVIPVNWPHTLFAVDNTLSDAADTRTFIQVMSGGHDA